MAELPPGWTEIEIIRWSVRTGDPTYLITINIGPYGIGSSGQFRDWLLGQGYRIDREWWEQNEFYVFRIWGTISWRWIEMVWGAPRAKYYIPPPTPDIPEPVPQPEPPPPEPEPPGPKPEPIPEKPTCHTISTTKTSGTKGQISL